MTVELQPKSDGRLHFSLGPIEKWIVAAAGSGIALLAWWMVASIQTLLTQQALTNQQLTTIVGQQADYPTLRSEVARMDVRVSNLEDKTRELERTRSAR